MFHKSKYQLFADARRAALDDAGLSAKDVDGVFTTIITEGGDMSSMLMAALSDSQRTTGTPALPIDTAT